MTPYRVGGRWKDTLADLRAPVPSSEPEASSAWDEAREQALELRAAAAFVDAAGLTGLMADEAWTTHLQHWPKDVAEALHRISPDVDLHALHVFSSSQLMGWTNLTSGTAFEHQVADLANAGKIALPHGADHVALGGRTQDGWDAVLFKGHQVVGHAQIKFSQNDHIIQQHFAHWPQIHDVIANHEAAQTAASHGLHVVDAGVGYDGLHDHVAHAIDAHWSLSGSLHEFVPEISLALIGVGWLALKWQGGAEARSANAWAKKQAALAGTANAAATVVSIGTGLPILRLPTALFTRFSAARHDVAESVGERVSDMRTGLEAIRRRAEAVAPLATG